MSQLLDQMRGEIGVGSFFLGRATSGARMEVESEALCDVLNPCCMTERPTRADRGANRFWLFLALQRADLGSPPSSSSGLGWPQSLPLGKRAYQRVGPAQSESAESVFPRRRRATAAVSSTGVMPAR